MNAPTSSQIHISIETQELSLVDGDHVLARYPISSSKFGTGTEEGSFKTPLGGFFVDEMIGDDAPEGTIFRSRKATGMWTPDQNAPEDLVLTRILWLQGASPENANTKDRYIYIHGTNHEDLIGQAESQGCIRMKNLDVVDLYQRVEVGTRVQITT